MPLDTQDLINYSEASRLLSVTRVTIYKMIKRGQLHPVAVAERRFLSRVEVEKLKNEGSRRRTGTLSQEGETDGTADSIIPEAAILSREEK